MTRPNGYLSFIRENHDFRYLWVGQIISNLGDWFNLIASASLVASLTESGLAVGGLFVIRTLAPFFASPIGGVIADRYNRRNVLIITDLLRVIVMLGFLLVREPGDVWLLYTLTGIQLFMSGIFYPTRTAILPDIVPEQGIGIANAISGATFSAMLAIGSGLGGLVVGTIGIYPAFIIDAFTFLLSAVFIAQVAFKPRQQGVRKRTLGAVLPEYLDGLRYMKQHPYLLAITSHKAFVGLLLGSTFEIVQVAIAKEVFTAGEGGSLSLGMMFFFAGVGLGVGPLVARRFSKDRRRYTVWNITIGYFLGGLGLALTAMLTNYSLILLGAFLRGVGNGMVWLFSTELVLQLVPTHVRGRVVGTEFAFSMLVSAIGATVVGAALDSPLGITGVAWWMAGLTLIPIIAWSLWLIAGEHEWITLRHTTRA